jgi:26S proteasome regulatory subunit T4
MTASTGAIADPREKVLQDYRKKLLEHKEVESRLKESMSLV